jgi:hypothetical protein
VLLTVAEHAEAHHLLFEKYGREGDRLAWLALSGQIDKEQIIHERQVLGGRHPKSIKTKEKIAAAKRGKQFSIRHKQNLAAAHRGIPLSIEHRASLSRLVPWNKGKKTGIPAWNKGKHPSAESRAKMSASAKRRLR